MLNYDKIRHGGAKSSMILRQRKSGVMPRQSNAHERARSGDKATWAQQA